jgi:hypothetical protein
MSARRWPQVRQPRRCDLCGEAYQRRHLIESWDVQNPGHRAGWAKTRLRICTRCKGAGAATRILQVAIVRPAKGAK